MRKQFIVTKGDGIDENGVAYYVIDRANLEVILVTLSIGEAYKCAYVNNKN